MDRFVFNSGYLLKNIDIEQMLFAIRHISAGGRYICSEIVFQMLKKQLNSPAESVTAQAVDLSQREEEVLHLIADGFTNQEMAKLAKVIKLKGCTYIINSGGNDLLKKKS